MTRKEFIDKMSPEEKTKLEEIKQKNEEIKQKNQVIMGLNADLRAIAQDFFDADNAPVTAQAALGATEPKPISMPGPRRSGPQSIPMLKPGCQRHRGQN